MVCEAEHALFASDQYWVSVADNARDYARFHTN